MFNSTKLICLAFIFPCFLYATNTNLIECPKSRLNKTEATESIGYRSCIQRTSWTSVSIVGDQTFSLSELQLFFERNYVSQEARNLYQNSRFWNIPANVSLGVGGTGLLVNLFLAFNSSRESIPALWAGAGAIFGLGILFWYFEGTNLTAAVNRYNQDLQKIIGQQSLKEWRQEHLQRTQTIFSFSQSF